MQSIIENLTQKERAMLHTALRAFKQSAEQCFAATSNTIQNSMTKRFYKDTQDNCTNLSNKLFSDCFVEDLDYMEQYAKELSALNIVSAEIGG